MGTFPPSSKKGFGEISLVMCGWHPLTYIHVVGKTEPAEVKKTKKRKPHKKGCTVRRKNLLKKKKGKRKEKT